MAVESLKRKASFGDSARGRGKKRAQLQLHGQKSLDNSVASIEANSEDDNVPPPSPPQPKANLNPTPSIPHGSRKLPTAAEVDAITTSFNSYRSAQFHGLLTSLLQDVSPPSDVFPPVENILRELHVFLTGLERVEAMHPLEAARKLEAGSSKSGKKKEKEKEKEKEKRKGVKITWPDPAPTEETKYTVGFEPPTVEGIYLAGSFAGAEGKKTLVRSRQGKFCADLVVEIPKTLLQEKDFLNSRVFHVRAYYLAHLASQIVRKKSPVKDKVQVWFDSPGGDTRKTSLILTPINGSFSDSFTIRIILALPQDSPIPLNRLSPKHCSIRPPNTPQIPTPHYSSILALLTLPKSLLLFTYTLSTEVPAFADTLRLLKVWSAQRGYYLPVSGVGASKNSSQSENDLRGSEVGTPLLWTCLIGALIFGENATPGSGGKTYSKGKKRKPIMQIGRGLSSYQLFRAVMDVLASRDFVGNHLFVKPSGEEQTPPFPREQWDEHSGPVLVEPTGRYNILDGIPGSLLELMALDARRTLDTLNRSATGSNSEIEVEVFQEVFTRDMREPNGRFDAYFEVDLSRSKVPSSIIAEQDAGSHRAYALENVVQKLILGLSNRIRALTILSQPSPPYATSSVPTPSGNKISLGVIFNPAEAFRLVDRGPTVSASDDESPSEELKAFRSLWGSKSELRRFKDGAIQQSVVWDLPGGLAAYTARERISGRIVRHLLSLHFGIKDQEVKEVFVQLDHVLCLDKAAEKDVGTAISAGWTTAQKSFEDLAKLLKSISSSSDVPLALNAVQPASPYLRYTSVFPAFPASSTDSFQTWSSKVPPNNRYIPTLPIVLHFEKSTNWPDDIKAIQFVKLALLEALARSLSAKSDWEGVARVAIGSAAGNLELEEWGGSDKARLEIITPEGFAFKAGIYHNREAILLRKVIDLPKSVNPLLASDPKPTTHERHLASLALHRHTQHYIHEPAHHSAILTLHHRYPALSHTIRLVKRFLNSQLLGGSLHENAIELLVCASFFKDAPTFGTKSSTLGNNLPSSGVRGFVSFLRFVSEWDWVRGVDVPIYAIAKAEAAPESTSLVPEVDNVEADDLVSTGTSYHLRTANDLKGVVFTSPATTVPGPPAVVARRLIDVVRSAYAHVSANPRSPNYQLLFNPSTKHYDFAIHIKPSVLAREWESIDRCLRRGPQQTPSHDAIASQEEPIRPGFDVVSCYFLDLQRMYADTALLFTDVQCPTKIFGVWNPTLKEPRRWRVLAGYNAKPAPPEAVNESKKEKDLVVLNEQSILKEMVRMGDGIVEKLELLKAAQTEEDSDGSAGSGE